MKFDLNQRLAIFQRNVRALPALEVPAEVRRAAKHYGFNLNEETEHYENSNKNQYSDVGGRVLRNPHSNQ